MGNTGRACRLLVLSALFCGASLACGGTSNSATTTAATTAPASRFGALIMAHGGTQEWNEGVLESVKPLREKYDIEVAFGMADATTMQAALRKLEAKRVDRVAVVRLFISGESWTERTEQIFGLRPGAPLAGAMQDAHASHESHDGHSMAFFRIPTTSSFALSTHGLADAPSMGVVLADRAAALSKDPSHEDIVILAHGPGDEGENARWLEKLDQRAAAVRARAPFRRVHVETLREDWPDKRVLAEKRIRAFVERASAEGGKAIVIPFRVQGFGPYKEVLNGLDYVADGHGLVPHPEVTKWVDGQITALASTQFRTVRAD